jgi:hypothetical protein
LVRDRSIISLFALLAVWRLSDNSWSLSGMLVPASLGFGNIAFGDAMRKQSPAWLWSRTMAALAR